MPAGALRGGKSRAWKTVARAIPHGEAEAVGKLLGVTADTVRRWRRETGGETATGRHSPLDQFLSFLQAVAAIHFEGAELLVERVASEIASLRQVHDQTQAFDREEAEGRLRELAREVNAIADGLASKR